MDVFSDFRQNNLICPLMVCSKFRWDELHNRNNRIRESSKCEMEKNRKMWELFGLNEL